MLSVINMMPGFQNAEADSPSSYSSSSLYNRLYFHYVRGMASYGYRENTEPHKFVRLLKNRKLSIILAGVLMAVLLITFSNKGLLRRVMLEKELHESDAHVAELSADIEALKKERDLLRNDLSTIEHVARESHGMIRHGEIVYRIRPSKGHAPQ